MNAYTHVCRAPIVDTPDAELLELYREMPARSLRALRRALALDAEHAARLSTRAFCERRIALIDRVLGGEL